MVEVEHSGAGILEEDPGALFMRPADAAGLIWAALARACVARDSPWRTPVLATVSPDGAPEARLLVLRAADFAARRLELHSDSRSAKLESMATEPRVALCFWDSRAQLQLRASGVAAVSADFARRESAWARVPEESRRNYRSESAPGTVSAGTESEVATANRPDAGFGHFAILDVELCRLEWLWLGRAPHSRGCVTWTDGRWRPVLLTP